MRPAEGSVTPDDWPPGALPFSLVMAVGSAAVCVTIVFSVDRGWQFMVGTIVASVLAFSAGVGLYVAALGHVFRGEGIPARYGAFSVLAAGAGAVGFAVETSVGGAMLAGLWGGLMGANVWAIRTVRRMA